MAVEKCLLLWNLRHLYIVILTNWRSKLRSNCNQMAVEIRNTTRIMDRSAVMRLVIFIALNYFTVQVFCQLERCWGSFNYCSAQFGDMNAICKNGYCYCTGKDYDYNTCLPDAYGCKIVRNPNGIYSCSPDNSSSQYELHVLAVYEATSGRPSTAAKASVDIISRGRSNRPIVLVLSSYEPVNWVLNIPSHTTIAKVILVAYDILESSVSGDVSRVKNIERIGMTNSEWSCGFGSDLGGCNTVKNLKQIHKSFGVVTSFQGIYRKSQWSLELSVFDGSVNNGTSVNTSILPTAWPKVRRVKCSSGYCSGQTNMKPVCKDGYCYCNGKDYDYDTCLPDAYGCKIVANSDTTFTCTPENSSSKYEVHVLAVYEVINRRPPTAGDSNVNIISGGKSNRPIILVLVSYEPVNWVLNIPPDIIIDKVILVAFYILESSVSGDVSQVKNIERIGRTNSEWSCGYGSDIGGCNTVRNLKQIHRLFGVVTSFRGTYRTSRWSLELSPFNGTVNNGSNPITEIIPTSRPTIRRQKCGGIDSNCPEQSEDMKAFCKDGYCYCNGTDYDYDTCLPDAYGCKIVSNSDTTYTCTPDNSSPKYEIHVLAVYEVTSSRYSTAATAKAMVDIINRGKSNRPIILVLVSYEPVNWVLNIPSGVTIGKVILVSHYIVESAVSGDVNRVRSIERIRTKISKSGWETGYGSVSGDGGTVKTLKQIHKLYGVVTSFRGTYRTNRWSLELSPFNGTVNNGSSPIIEIIPTASPTIRRQKCRGIESNCPGQLGDMKAFCKDGYCYCNGTGYDYDTCLPDAYGCKIVSNSDTTYTCTPDKSSAKYEIHVLAVYEVTGTANVNMISRGESNRPIILVLVSYEPVNWVLKIPPDIIINTVILVSHVQGSSVRGDVNFVIFFELTSDWSFGYGSDSGGGATVKTLKQIHKRFGVVTSFRGTYRANRWSLELSAPFNGTGNVATTTGTSKPTFSTTAAVTSKPTFSTTAAVTSKPTFSTTAAVTSKPTFSTTAAVTSKPTFSTTAAVSFKPTIQTTAKVSPTVPRRKCSSDSYCPGQTSSMRGFCKDGYCYCKGEGYNCDTCLPDAYGCKILPDAKTALGTPRFTGGTLQKLYSCVPANSSSQYEVHVLSVYKVANRRSPITAKAKVNIVSRGKSNRPIVLVLVSYRAANWVLNIPSNVTINKVILVSFYIKQSSVSGDLGRVKNVERIETTGSDWHYGYGSDSGCGRTVKILEQLHDRFGVVTSFSGTYRANEWSLVLSSAEHGENKPCCQNIAYLSKNFLKLKTQMRSLEKKVESQGKRIGVLEKEGKN